MADAERLAFEQMLVHNLKAPLTGMLASLEMLHDGDMGALSALQRSTVAAMQAQGATLVRMIDELLELGRAEASSFTVQLLPVDLEEFLRGLRADWEVRIPRLTSDIAAGVTDVIADAEMLRRVFDNLLMNARIHAGADSGVSIRAERSGDAVKVTVTDDGPGIPAADADRIFEPFVTLARSGEQRSHGLGLAYCRAALAAMDGTIAYVPGDRGATFVIELPAAVVLTRQALEQDQ
jgi:two-component system sensor histidine kinase KdpD